jgi:hypothetical protein
MVGNQPVQKTPSASLTIIFNELEKLPLTPEIKKIQAHIKVSACSRRSRSSRHDKASQHQGPERPRYQAGSPCVYEGPRGNYEGHLD